MEGNLVLGIFSWWYGEAFRRILLYTKRFFLFLFDEFSVGICLRTLFSVWRRDTISYESLSIQEKFQVWMMNNASRFVGMIVKLSTIIAYIFSTTIFFFVAIFVFLFWLSYPIAPILIAYLAWLGGAK